MNHSQNSEFEFHIENGPSDISHSHPMAEILYPLSDGFAINLSGSCFNLSSGDLIAINAGQSHIIVAPSEGLMCRLNFSQALLRKCTGKNYINFSCNSSVDHVSDFEPLKSLVQQMATRFIENDQKNDLFLTGLVYQFISMLYEHFSIPVREDDDNDDERIAHIIGYMESNYSLQPNLTELSGELHLSTAYLSRYFKSHFGVNFMDYLLKTRMDHAVDELISTEDSITQISISNGFSNSSAFNKHFRTIYHMTPSAYKKERQVSPSVPVNNSNAQIREKVQKYMINLKRKTEGEKEQELGISADASRKNLGSQSRNIMINGGAIGDLLVSSIQNHLLFLHKELKFRYIRIWNIHSEELQLRQGHESKILNFDKFDIVLDFLVQNGMKPFIDLGNKPRRIQKNPIEAVLTQERSTPYLGLSEFESVLTSLMDHLIVRYGKEEVASWRFELWDASWAKNKVGRFDYFTVIFPLAYRIIKSFSPDTLVGGSGMHLTHDSEVLIDGWSGAPIRPDFLSFYYYAYGEPTSTTFPESGGIRSQDPDDFIHKLTNMRQYIEKCGLSSCPIYITECGMTFSDRNFVNDSCIRSAYFIYNTIASLGKVDLIGTWLASDLFSTHYDSYRIFNGGTGLLSKDGICKPLFYAFTFLNRLGNEIIACGKNYILTGNGQRSYYFLYHNYKPLNFRYYQKNENEFRPDELPSLVENSDFLTIHTRLKNVTNGEYYCKIHRLNSQHGSALDEWKQFDYMDSMRPDDIEYIKSICTPQITNSRLEIRDGTLLFDLTLLGNEVTLVHIYPYR
jgi:beta-xylosidase/AraC-like DNA-binding protein